MNPDGSIAFFDRQFREQIHKQDFQLNPFELASLPHLHGRVLDFGCGLGNLAILAAQRGCEVVALDASPAAIAHLRRKARDERLAVEAIEADLRDHEIAGDFDRMVCVGLLMFFDCATAFTVLSQRQARVRPGGIAAINVLVEGTSYLDMFQPDNHCLFGRGELENRFAGWNIIHSELQEFEAPGQAVKSFVTLIARMPAQQYPDK
jgi:tellurite methyltransferase